MVHSRSVLVPTIWQPNFQNGRSKLGLFIYKFFSTNFWCVLFVCFLLTIWMDSVFEWSEFEPPLYYSTYQSLQLSLDNMCSLTLTNIYHTMTKDLKYCLSNCVYYIVTRSGLKWFLLVVEFSRFSPGNSVKMLLWTPKKFQFMETIINDVKQVILKPKQNGGC